MPLHRSEVKEKKNIKDAVVNPNLFMIVFSFKISFSDIINTYKIFVNIIFNGMRQKNI